MLDFQDHEVELRRKLLLLAATYQEAKVAEKVTPSTRKAHISLFALNVAKGDLHHSLSRQRVGLTTVESVLALLSLDIKVEKLVDVLAGSANPNITCWAEISGDEWDDKNAMGYGWLPAPIVCALVKQAPSTFRHVVTGMREMGLLYQRTPMRTPGKQFNASRSLSLTSKGKNLFEEFEK